MNGGKVNRNIQTSKIVDQLKISLNKENIGANEIILSQLIL